MLGLSKIAIILLSATLYAASLLICAITLIGYLQWSEYDPTS